jgi:hypothetical protein
MLLNNKPLNFDPILFQYTRPEKTGRKKGKQKIKRKERRDKIAALFV